MSLNYIKEKIKDSEREIYLTLLVVLVGLSGFGLGRLSRLEESRVPITIKSEGVTTILPENKIEKTVLLAGSYVASKTGSSYYLPWCSGVKRIKEENKVWFNTKEDAERAGLKPATNCKGI